MIRDHSDQVGDVPTGRCMDSVDGHNGAALFCIFNLGASDKSDVRLVLERFPVGGVQNRRGGVCFEAGESVANQAIEAVRKSLMSKAVIPAARRMT